MKRDHQNGEGEQDSGNNQNNNNNNNGPSGPKRFRQNDEILRVLIPSRVSIMNSIFLYRLLASIQLTF